MPLYTRITRDGEAIGLRWGWWHVGCMMEAAKKDAGQEDIKDTPLWKEGAQVLQARYGFEDPEDGERLELLPGDRLEAWRGF